MNTKHYIAWMTMATASMAACTIDDQQAFVGQPINVAISLDSEGSTRTATAMTTGTAYLIGNSNPVRAYTWSGTAFTSDAPLIWTAATMDIYGYYADGGQTAVASPPSYSMLGKTANASFLAGAAQTTFSQTSQEPINLTLRQQLAYISVTVKADGTPTLTNAKLGNGMLYTSGTFANSFETDSHSSAYGYGNGGNNGGGWTVSGTATTIDMIPHPTKANTYYARIIPQTIGTSKAFFTVSIDGFNIGFTLASETTFRAGCKYDLVAEHEVSYTLYVDESITVSDFTSGTSGSFTNVNAN